MGVVPELVDQAPKKYYTTIRLQHTTLANWAQGSNGLNKQNLAAQRITRRDIPEH